MDRCCRRSGTFEPDAHASGNVKASCNEGDGVLHSLPLSLSRGSSLPSPPWTHSTHGMLDVVPRSADPRTPQDKHMILHDSGAIVVSLPQSALSLPQPARLHAFPCAEGSCCIVDSGSSPESEVCRCRSSGWIGHKRQRIFVHTAAKCAQERFIWVWLDQQRERQVNKS